MTSSSPDQICLSRSFLARMARLGATPRALERWAAMAPGRLDAARPVVTTAEYFAMFRGIERHAGPDAGLALATAAPARPDNVALIAALYSPTFGAAIARLARYKRLVCPEAISVTVSGVEARLEFAWLLATADPPGVLVDDVFAGVVALAGHSVGDRLCPLRLELTRAPARARALGRHFGCPVVFEAASDALILPAAALARPMMSRDAALLARLIPELEIELGQDGRRHTQADQVRAVLLRRLGAGRVSLADVARALGVSGRTLQRRLHGAGTTYQGVLDDVRRRTSLRLLARPQLTTGEIAFVLGFDEVNSFTRAFRVWEGTTPAAWRARRQRAGISERGPAGRAPRPLHLEASR